MLILQGENCTQHPIQQAFVLQQALTDKKHPDHSLITYPNLGHLVLSILPTVGFYQPPKIIFLA
jgi:hypothetical protein